MSSFKSLPTTPEIFDNYKKLIETLPKGNGWRVQTVYNYKGFWFTPDRLTNNLLLHTFFKPHPTDIFLASFPKSGTTWLKALMFSTLNRHRYTFSDHHLHHHGPQGTIPFLDLVSYNYPFPDSTSSDVVNVVPRLFNTHFAHTLLPSCITSCNIVYVCRDPKDVLISMWHFLTKARSKDLSPLSLDEAFELFCQGVSEYGPFWEHVLSYWRLTTESPDKILFLKYEELKTQPEVMVRKLAAFMGVPFTAEEEEKGVVGDIVKLCSFKNLSNLEVNKKGVEKFGDVVTIQNRNFFRKGEIGDWNNYLSEEMGQRIDRITDEKLRGSGLVLTATG